MGAIKAVRAKKGAGVALVNRGVDEVAVQGLTLKPRQGVGESPVQMVDELGRGMQIRTQRNLHAVVDGTSYRLKEENFPEVRVFPRESNVSCACGKAASKEQPSGDAVPR